MSDSNKSPEDGLDDAYQKQAGRVINLAEFGAERFTGPPPPIEWLVEGTIPLGVPGVLAGMGDIGKSFLALQVGFEVTMPPEAPKGNLDFNNVRPILGGRIAAHGSAVFLTSEDNEGAVHRRLNTLDPHERRRNYPGKLMVVPARRGRAYAVVRQHARWCTDHAGMGHDP